MLKIIYFYGELQQHNTTIQCLASADKVVDSALWLIRPKSKPSMLLIHINLRTDMILMQYQSVVRILLIG